MLRQSVGDRGRCCCPFGANEESLRGDVAKNVDPDLGVRQFRRMLSQQRLGSIRGSTGATRSSHLDASCQPRYAARRSACPECADSPGRADRHPDPGLAGPAGEMKRYPLSSVRFARHADGPAGRVTG